MGFHRVVECGLIDGGFVDGEDHDDFGFKSVESNAITCLILERCEIDGIPNIGQVDHGGLGGGFFDEKAGVFTVGGSDRSNVDDLTDTEPRCIDLNIDCVGSSRQGS